ncbi:GtrA family protein [Inhella proteolytica]|uniref:GtrA family protein n=1 Tax=Inhella proteolytica TaxID=2795029 RepID=A0A931J508_9BURK|nr:GtrA family protein [Inhella proteolytica]MBH9578381.1 GtrA family protein [Inhella proteolytica]
MTPHNRLLRYLIVGACSFLAAQSIFAALIYLARWPYLVAFTATFFAVNIASYIASRLTVFGSTTIALGEGMARWFGVAISTLAINNLLMFVLVDGMSCHPLVASIALSIINMPISYLLHRRLTFNVQASHTGNQSLPR